MKRTFLFLLLIGSCSMMQAASVAQQETTAKDTLLTCFDTFIDYQQTTTDKQTQGFIKIGNKLNFWRHGLLGFDMGQVASKREKVLLGLMPYAYNTSDDFWKKTAITSYPVGIYAIKRKIQTNTCWSIFYGQPDANPPGDGFSYSGSYPLVFPATDMELIAEFTVGKTDSMQLLTVDITSYINKYINTKDSIYFLIASPAKEKVDCSLFFKSSEASESSSPKLLLFDEKPVVSLSAGRDLIAGETDSLHIYFPTNATAPFAVSYTDGKDTIDLTNVPTYEYTVAIAPTVSTTYTLLSASDAQSELDVDGKAEYNVIQPNAKISGKNKIYKGDAADLTISFVGIAPYSYTVVGTDGSSYTKSNVTKSEVTITVSPKATCTYTVQTASDANNPTILTAGDAVVTVIDRPLPMMTAGAEDWLLIKGDEFGQEQLNTTMWTIKTGSPATDGENLLLGVDKSGTSFVAHQMQMVEAMPTNTDMYMEARVKPMPVVNTGFQFNSNAYNTSLSSKYQQRYGMIFPKLTNLGDDKYDFHYSLTDWKTNYYISEIDPSKTLNIMMDSVMDRTCGEYMVLGIEITATNMRYYIDGELVAEAANMDGYNSSDFINAITAAGSAYQDVAQLAYGYYEQEDWHYYGGYTGDLMAMLFGVNIDVSTFQETDLDKTAAIDYIRFFHRKSDMAPVAKDLTFPEVSEATTIALDTAIQTMVDNTFYFSTIFAKDVDSEFMLTLLDNNDKAVAGALVNTSNALRAGFGGNKLYYASTVSAKPTNKKQAYYVDNQMYLMVGRVETHAEGDDVMSVSLYPIQDSKTQPYFYPNIEGEYGHTAYGNGWDINQKYEIGGSSISKVRLDGAGEFRCQKFLLSSSFEGVMPQEAVAILDNDAHYIGSGEAAQLSVQLTGVAPWTITYKEGNQEHTVKDITASPYTIVCTPAVSTTYTLMSLTDGNGNAGIVTGSNTVKVKSARAMDLYPYFDTYVDGNQPEKAFYASPTGYMKKHATFQRDAYFRFDISEYDPSDSMTVANFSMYLISNDQGDQTQLTLFQIKAGMPDPLESLVYSNAPNEADMKSLGTITAPNPGFYGVRVNWDLHKFINQELKTGSGIVDLCVKVTGGNTASLLTWRQYVADSVALEPQLPYLALDPYDGTALEGVKADAADKMAKLTVYPNPAKDYVNVVGNYEGRQVKIMSAAGQVMATTLVQGNRVALPANYQGVAYMLVETEKGYAVAPIIMQ